MIQFGHFSARLSWVVSVFGEVGALTMFLKSGPTRIVEEGWSKSTLKQLFSCFLAVFLTLVGKMYFLMFMMIETTGWSTAELVGVWAAFLLLPQFLISILALSTAVGCCRLLPTIAQYPALVANPMLTSVTFGRHNKYGYIAFSPMFTIANSIITVVMAVALFVVTGDFYALSDIRLLGSVGVLVGGSFCAIDLALAVKFPNSMCAKKSGFTFVDVAVFNVVTGDSEADADTNTVSDDN